MGHNFKCPITIEFGQAQIHLKTHFSGFLKTFYFSWMELNCRFQPLFDKLLYIRHLSLVRPAIPVAVNPRLCWVAFYFTLDRNGQVVYSTDQQPDYKPEPSGKFLVQVYVMKNDFITFRSRIDVCLLSMVNSSCLVQFV